MTLLRNVLMRFWRRSQTQTESHTEFWTIVAKRSVMQKSVWQIRMTILNGNHAYLEVRLYTVLFNLMEFYEIIQIIILRSTHIVLCLQLNYIDEGDFDVSSINQMTVYTKTAKIDTSALKMQHCHLEITSHIGFEEDFNKESKAISKSMH